MIRSRCRDKRETNKSRATDIQLLSIQFNKAKNYNDWALDVEVVFFISMQCDRR